MIKIIFKIKELARKYSNKQMEKYSNAVMNGKEPSKLLDIKCSVSAKISTKLTLFYSGFVFSKLKGDIANVQFDN